MKHRTVELVQKHGGQWAVIEWDYSTGEWSQVGPYYDTEAEALEAKGED